MVLKEHYCPYCNKKIGFSKMFSIKNDLEYCCENCHKISYVKMGKKINNWVFALIILCVAVIVAFSFILRVLFIGTLVLLLLFIGFYLLVPNFLNLSTKKRNANRKSKG